jgi:hypothetical protein
MGVRDGRLVQPWLWLAGLVLSCGSGSDAACRDEATLATQIQDQAQRDGLSTTGLCVHSQQEFEALLRANGITADVPSRAAEYVEACRRLRASHDECGK